jgi:hypothetical protein
MYQTAEHISDWLCRIAYVPLVATTAGANNNSTNKSIINCTTVLGVGALAMGFNSIRLSLGPKKWRENILAAWQCLLPRFGP